MDIKNVKLVNKVTPDSILDKENTPNIKSIDPSKTLIDSDPFISKCAPYTDHHSGSESTYENLRCLVPDPKKNYLEFKKSDNSNSDRYLYGNFEKKIELFSFSGFSNSNLIKDSDACPPPFLTEDNCAGILKINDIREYQKQISSQEYITPDIVLEENLTGPMPSFDSDHLNFQDFLESEGAAIGAGCSNLFFPHSDSNTWQPKPISTGIRRKSKNSVMNDENTDNIGMELENNWCEDTTCFAAPNISIPLPPPPRDSSAYDDFPSCGPYEGPENGPYTENLDSFFSVHEQGNDVPDLTAEAGVCGLRNLGNTCFMGAGLQCLAATQSLVLFFMRIQNDLEENNSLTNEFSSLIKRMWNGQFSIVSPLKFKEVLGVICPQFKDNSQHDCQEFLALLLDALHQQLLMNPYKQMALIRGYSPKNVEAEVLMDIDSPPSTSVKNMENLKMSPDSSTEQTSMFRGFEKNCNNAKLNSEKISEMLEECDPSSSDNDEFSTKDEDNNVMAVAGSLDIEDILKEAKTSNVNVLVDQTEANNEIRFDSEKFPKMERRKNETQLNVLYNIPNHTNGKRGNSNTKSVNNYSTDSEEGFDLKRIKMNDLNNKNSEMKIVEKNVRMENERKLKILNEKAENNSGFILNSHHDNDNYQELQNYVNGIEEEEDENKENNNASVNTTTSESDQSMPEVWSDGDRESDTDEDGDSQWKKIASNNDTVIFDSFQGQFKNKVICSVCKFKSVTYEPFMYLSVPLPHANEKQLCITFVPASKIAPMQYLLTLNKSDGVTKIIQHLQKLKDVDSQYMKSLSNTLIVTEVLECHIAKILDDTHLIRYMDDINRKIYVFEQLIVEQKPINETEPDVDSKMEASTSGIISATCTICLEEKDTEIRKHRNCDCVLCDICFKRLCSYASEEEKDDKQKKNTFSEENSWQDYSHVEIQCPVCRKNITLSADLIPIQEADVPKHDSIRMLNIPIVYRIDSMGDGNNNQKKEELFGHPGLLKLPSQIAGEELYNVINTLHSYKKDFKLLLVDGRGLHCSRCMYNQHCTGCVVSKELSSLLSLRTDDTLAVSFMEDMPVVSEVLHQSMASLRPYKAITLNDCVDAFCQSETLDEFNPWYCPRCEKNQRATKSMSVRQFPNYLIVYLKRFVFHEGTSIKLEDKVKFPYHGFSFNKNNKCTYDLYACVCHSGGVSVGHYIAYTQHPNANDWHCFNDEQVTKLKPQDEEYSNAYILFYKKRGVETIKSEDLSLLD